MSLALRRAEEKLISAGKTQGEGLGDTSKIRTLEHELEDHQNREVEHMNSLLDLKLKLSEETKEKERLKRELTSRKKST